ncbi:MAG: Uma2 family endonuclease [Spirochaetaceae bacterium]|nr:Uma2 family endonuclease [Spirochaetaceae bacterium]
MGIPMRKEERAFTYADYLSWPAEERWELIDGAAYDMSPVPNRRHQGIVGTILGELYQFLQYKPCDVYVAPFDVRLAAEKDAADDEIINVVQPDVSVFCSEEKLDDAGAVAAPDIAAEVLSPYTSVKDQREKLALYERFGVKEYWIIDPANQTLSVYSLSGIAAGGSETGGSYSKPAVYGPEDTFTSSVVEGFQLKLADVFG